MEQVLNWFKTAWATVSEFFVNAYNQVRDLCVTAFDFLVETFGFTMAVVQASIVGLLAVLLLIFIIIAIINPKKRRKKKLEKINQKQRRIDELRLEIAQLDCDIASVELEISLVNKKCSDEIFNLNEEDKLLALREKSLVEKGKGRIDELVQKQKILTEYLKNQQSGIFKSMKKAETTKRLISDIDDEKNEYTKQLSQTAADTAVRRQEIIAEINKLNADCQAQQTALSQKLDSLKQKKSELQKELNELLGQVEDGLTVQNLKTMTDEYEKQQRQTEKDAENKALEELKLAKAEYEAAYKKRIQTEKDTAQAIENVKETQKEKTKKNKKTPYTPTVTAKAVISEERHNDVNIIIADVNSEVISKAENVEIKEDKDETYSEPAVEIVDMNTLSEEEVIYIEAVLDDVNLDDNTEAEQVAISETNAQTVEEIQSEEPDLKSDEEKIQTEETSAKAEETPATEELPVEESVENEGAQIQPSVENGESTERDIDGDKTQTKKQPQYKDYNDGIPATPIFKDGKSRKPLTKIVKKAKETNENSTALEVKQPTKTGYNGKWQVEKGQNGVFATLRASNGGILLTTTEFTTLKSLKNHIETVKTLLDENSVSIVNLNGKFVCKIISQKGRTVIKSAEYTSKSQCEKLLESAKRFAKTAIICE